MKILAVDTALGACSAAVLDGERVLRAPFRGDGARPCRSAGARWSRRRWPRRAWLFRARPARRHDRARHLHRPARRPGLHARAAGGAEKPLVGRHHAEAMAAAALAETGAEAAAAAPRCQARRGLSGGRQRCGPASGGFRSSRWKMQLPCLKQALTPGLRLALAGTAAAAAAGLLDGTRTMVTAIAQPDALWVARLALAA